MATMVVLVYGLVLFAVQTTLAPMLAVSDIIPDLALIATVYCAITLSFSQGLASGFLLGFAQGRPHPFLADAVAGQKF